MKTLSLKKLSLERLKPYFVLPQRKGLFFITLGLVFLTSTLIALATEHQEKPLVQNEVDSTVVVTRLDELQDQLKALDAAVNKPFPEVNLNGVTQQIEQLSSRIEALRQSDSDKLAQTITHSEAAIGQELHSIKEVVTHLDDKTSPIKYVSIQNLPFTIVSIDSIQQVPVASIAYDYKTIPLEKGDSLAGWKVVCVDYSTQRVELENAKQERVVVTHEHIG